MAVHTQTQKHRNLSIMINKSTVYKQLTKTVVKGKFNNFIF